MILIYLYLKSVLGTLSTKKQQKNPHTKKNKISNIECVQLGNLFRCIDQKKSINKSTKHKHTRGNYAPHQSISKVCVAYKFEVN